MRSRSSGVTRSSASSERIQSPVAWSMAKFFWAAKPGHGRTETLSVNSCAICTVLSPDSASTTTISSAQATLSRQARRRSSSFHAMIVTESRLTARSPAGRAWPGPRPPPPPAPGPPSCRPGSGARGRVARRDRCAPRSSARRGRGSACPGPRPGAAGPVSLATMSAQRRSRAASSCRSVGGARIARALDPSRIWRAMWTSSGPHRSRTLTLGSLASRSTRRRKCATGHCLFARPAPGFTATSRSRLFTPCSPRKSSMRRVARGGDRHEELDRPRRDAERPEEGQVLVHHVHRLGGRAHAAVREEAVQALAAVIGGEADAQRRAGVGGEQPALDEALQIEGDVEARRADAPAQAADLADHLAHARRAPDEPAPEPRVHRHHRVEVGVVLQQGVLARLHDPREVDAGPRPAERARHRDRVDDVAERRQLDDGDFVSGARVSPRTLVVFTV